MNPNLMSSKFLMGLFIVGCATGLAFVETMPIEMWFTITTVVVGGYYTANTMGKNSGFPG
jgi:hypothetical protein